MLPARSLPFELVHEDEFQISQRKAVHRRLGIFMGLVEGHRERGSIRITPVFPKVAIGTWFHPGDQDLPWIVGTELPRVTLPYGAVTHRSEEHTSELKSLMRISYAVFCLKNTQNRHKP